MQLSALLVFLAAATSAVADVHLYASCYSHIQPVGNPNKCTIPKRSARDLFSRGVTERGAYGDNAAATTAACNAYKRRNTGPKQWDTCPDCTLYQRHQVDSTECTMTCNSAAKHIGGDEWNYYCKQAGADGSYAY